MEPATRAPGHGELEDARGEQERRMERERITSQELYEEAVRLSQVHQAYLLEEQRRPRGVPASGRAIVSLRVPTAAEAAGLDCPVCLDQLSQGDGRLRMMPCSHAFHQRCIFNWLKANGTCPCCRFKLPTEEEQRLLDEQQAAAQAGPGGVARTN